MPTTTFLNLDYPDPGAPWLNKMNALIERLDRLGVSGDGDPNGNVTPLYYGAFYYDTTNDELWIAAGTGNSDWVKAPDQIKTAFQAIGEAFKWTQGHFGSWVELTPSGSPSAVTPDLADGNFFFVDIASDLTVNAPSIPSLPSNSNATTMTLVVKYSASNLTLSWGSDYKWLGGTAPPNTQTSGSKDLFSFVLDPDGEWIGNADLDR